MLGWRALRDRWLADPAVRRRIGSLPVGRRIAERHAARLFGIVSGFAQTQMLGGAIESGLFDLLRADAVDQGDIARRLDLPPPGATALIQAMIALGLLEMRDDAVALTIDGLVVATDPGLRAMIAHNQLLYRDLADPLAMLRQPGSGELARFWPYAGGAGDAAGYSALMAASQGFVAEAIIAAVDFGKVRSVVDIGGGDGSFLAAVAAATPRPRLTLVDLPAVARIAMDRLAERELGARIAVVAHGDPVPRAETVTLVRVLHDRDDAAAVELLREAAAALEPGGRIVVAEPVARHGIDAQSAYFAAYFLAMGSGRLRTLGEIDALLAQADLKRHRTTSTMLVTVIEARQFKA